MADRSNGLNDTLTLSVGDSRVRLVGLRRLSPATRRWVDEALGPLAGAGDPAVELVVSEVEPVPRGAISRGLALHPRGVWIGDRPTDGGLLRLDGDHPIIEVTPTVCVATLRNPLYVLAAQIALWTTGGTILRVAAVEVAGRAIVLAGAPGTGKTLAVLALLRRGARLVGDSVVGVTGDGTIVPLLGDVKVRRPPAATQAWQRRLVGRLDANFRGRSSRTADRLRRVGGVLARVTDRDGAEHVGVDRLGAELAIGARVDELVLLRPSAQAEPSRFVRASGAAFLALHHAAAAVAEELWPAGDGRSLVADRASDAAIAASAFRAASTVEVPNVLDPASADRLADRLLHTS